MTLTEWPLIGLGHLNPSDFPWLFDWHFHVFIMILALEVPSYLSLGELY
jgi:hypothetical protein